MTVDRKLAQATVLGGFAAGALLSFCLTLAGAGWLFVAFCYMDDHRVGGPGRTYPALFLATMMTFSLCVASRFGWRVGQDWYRNGR